MTSLRQYVGLLAATRLFALSCAGDVETGHGQALKAYLDLEQRSWELTFIHKQSLVGDALDTFSLALKARSEATGHRYEMLDDARYFHYKEANEQFVAWRAKDQEQLVSRRVGAGLIAIGWWQQTFWLLRGISAETAELRLYSNDSKHKDELIATNDSAGVRFGIHAARFLGLPKHDRALIWGPGDRFRLHENDSHGRGHTEGKVHLTEDQVPSLITYERFTGKNIHDQRHIVSVKLDYDAVHTQLHPVRLEIAESVAAGESPPKEVKRSGITILSMSENSHLQTNDFSPWLTIDREIAKQVTIHAYVNSVLVKSRRNGKWEDHVAREPRPSIKRTLTLTLMLLSLTSGLVFYLAFSRNKPQMQ